jgi:hypothetical protein
MAPPKSFVPDTPPTFVADSAGQPPSRDWTPSERAYFSDEYLRTHKPEMPSVSASPSPWSVEGIKNRIINAREWAVDKLPAIGGFAGGMVGTAAGEGAASVPLAVVGAGAGGTLGEDLRQTAEEHLHPEMRHMGPKEAALRLTLAGGKQGLQELGGQLTGKVAGRVMNAAGTRFIPADAFEKYPILKSVFAVGEGAAPNAAQHLTAAASTKQTAGTTLEAVTNTLGDLEQEFSKLPPGKKTIGDFLTAVNARKNAMNAESGIAMMPIAGQKTVPTGISDSVRKLIRSYMTNTTEGSAARKYLIKRAAEFDKPWTFRQLDELRTDMASQLAKHRMKGSVAKYTAEKGDLDLAVDNAILDGLRETVYPEMDRAAGRPQGYFEELKGRQSSLIALQEILDKRIKDLSGQQAISEVAPRFSSENLSGSVHPGSMPRLGIYGLRQVVSPTRELDAASKHVSKAFPSVDSLPYQVLFSATARLPQIMSGPKTKHLQHLADEQRQSASQ